MKPFASPEVAAVFNSYPKTLRSRLMVLRQLIFGTAAKTKGVGELEETLKWGGPAYVTKKSKSGSTIRIDAKDSGNRQYAMYFHCQTNLIDTFRSMFPNEFTFDGNRAIVFDENGKVPIKELRFCIAAALTYHRAKKSKVRTNC